MPFDQRAHAFIPDDTLDEQLPWLSVLEWYCARRYTDPDPADHAIWTLRGRVQLGPDAGREIVVKHTGRLNQVDLAALASQYPGVRVWHLTGRARAPYADQQLPDDVLPRRYSLLEILRAAAGTELDADQRSGVADTVSTLLADGTPFDDDNDIAGQVLETIARMAEAR